MKRIHEDMKLVLLVLNNCDSNVLNVCEMCGKKFNVKGSFKKHTEDVHVACDYILNTLQRWCFNNFPFKNGKLYCVLNVAKNI